MDNNVKLRILKKAILIRKVEERLLALFAEGKIYGTVHTCIGEELTGATLSMYLRDTDYVFSNHRCHGHFISVTDQVEGLIAEIMGKKTGTCGGWGGSQHLCYNRFFSNGIQGGFVPITAGLALTEKMNRTGNIAVCFIGEGTLGEGSVYETANLISKWELPALIIIENNRFSQSTPQELTLAGNILDRFACFEINCFDTTTWSLEHLNETMEQAVSYVREKCKPAVIRVETDRLMAHSKGDDDRPKEMIESYYARDILTQFKKSDPEIYDAFEQEAVVRIEAAVAKAMQEEYALRPTLVAKQDSDTEWEEYSSDEEKRINEIIRECFTDNMQKNQDIVMLGEDILDPYGGAFKVTKGLSTKYPERVKGTTISEYSLVGISNGLSLAGKFPVCEIMFGDFLTLTLDQILNHAAKFDYMYHHQKENPIIIRTPMGGGRGYGPTHSQSIEKYFMGIPQTMMLALNRRLNPREIYDALFDNLKHPAIVIENKTLYAKRLSSMTEDGFVVEKTKERYPAVRVRPEGDADVTILCYGGMLDYAEEAQLRMFDELDIIADIICPTLLYPLNINPILESVMATRKVIIVEEGNGFAGWGSETVTQICEKLPNVGLQIKRINMSECPIPCSGILEKELLPNTDSIMDAVREMMIG